MTLEDLPVEEYLKRISTYHPQTKPDMCYSASLMNSLNDLGRRIKLSKLRFSLKKMNKICGYRNGMMCDESIIPKAMSDILEPYNYEWKNERAPGMNIEKLKKISDDSGMSNPIVTVSSDHFSEIGVKTFGRRRLDHVIIIMGVDHTIIYYYDPFESFFKGTHKINRTMKIRTFGKLWDGAYEPRWTCWAQPKKVSQRLLSDFTPRGAREQ